MTLPPNSVGIILSSAYIAAGMVSEFGLLPPAFLPLANKRLYRWQVESLSPHVDHIVMSVPGTFGIESFGHVWLEKRNVEVLPLDIGKTLGEAVSSCLSHVSETAEDIWLLFGDTLLTKVDNLPKESVAIGYTEEHSRWGYCHPSDDGGLILSEQYRTEGVDNPVVVGCFRLSKTMLQKYLASSDNDFYTALNLYSSKHPIASVNTSAHWYDLGHINTYFRSRLHFTTERAFNVIQIDGRKVYKYSPESGKMRAETGWYENVPNC